MCIRLWSEEVLEYLGYNLVLDILVHCIHGNINWVNKIRLLSGQWSFISMTLSGLEWIGTTNLI